MGSADAKCQGEMEKQSKSQRLVSAAKKKGKSQQTRESTAPFFSPRQPAANSMQTQSGANCLPSETAKAGKTSHLFSCPYGIGSKSIQPIPAFDHAHNFARINQNIYQYSAPPLNTFHAIKQSPVTVHPKAAEITTSIIQVATVQTSNEQYE